MDFIAGKVYRNASGQFQVLSVGTSTMKLAYASGPPVGRVLIKRIADMARLATSEALAPSPSPSDGSGRRHSRKQTTPP
jgi:hypothetical protein